MKFCFATLLGVLVSCCSWSQITITAADMPVWGDTLRYSNTTPLVTPVSPADSGAGRTWNYMFTPTSQGRDDYKKPAEISPLYAFTLHTSCYGYKIADSIPGLSLLMPGISINNLYTFFNKFTTPNAYVAEAFGAQITGIPVGSNYITPDVIYMFPLNYGNNDSNNFALNYGLPSVASLKEKGYRKSRVDGWGTIVTPYYTTPTNCIRVRSEIHEIDSVAFDTISFGLPRVTVEYRYLVNGEHYPAVFATANAVGGFELITSVKYKDVYRPELNPPPTAVAPVAAPDNNVWVYPNPAVGGKVNLHVPGSWTSFYVEVFDIHSRLVRTFYNTTALDLESFPPGTYAARVVSGSNMAFVKIAL
jgi:hypothetical protein